MNLREFLDYRTNCLSCGSTLNLTFHSRKRQKHLYLNNRFMALLNMDSIQKGHKTYKVGYSIGMQDNSLAIEFCDAEEKNWFEDQSPLWLIDRFKKFNQNQGDFRFYKHCNICHHYNYTSNPFVIRYEDPSIGELTVHKECISLSKEIQDGYRIYRIVNRYNLSETWFDTYKASLKDISYDHPGWEMRDPIKTSLINCDFSNTDLRERIERLLPFS